MQSNLLPTNLDQFREEQFWDGFFKERQNLPFEWYGEYAQIAPLVTQKISQNSKILVPGCGNSELSAQLYDDQFQNICNIDFSKIVIREMLTKNLRSRPKMKWMVSDMTKTKFQNGEFDVILDKGSLDALMGEESEESNQIGKKYLKEMQRALGEKNEGLFFIVTLAQIHVLEVLISSFSRSSWTIVIHKVPPTKDMARSQLQPFLFTAARKQPHSTDNFQIDIKFKLDENAPDADHVKEVISFLENADKNQYQFEDFDDLYPGRRLQINLPKNFENPRYKATIIDTKNSNSNFNSQKTRCTVLLIPQGRENEWLFGNEKGQNQVAEQCGVGRLILVGLCRGHKFGSQKEVMKELSQYVVQFAPADVRNVENAIPYQTVQEGIGQRKEVGRVCSNINGEIVVEDVVIEDDERRRLVFMSASQLTQSEAVLDKTNKKNNKNSDEKLSKINHSILASEYHQLMTAALFLQNFETTSLSCLLIGLGGGGLPVFLNKTLGINVKTIELDKEVLEIATKYFDLKQNTNLQVQIGDGLQFIKDNNTDQYEIIMFDAGSSDPSLPMSCPPPDFVELEMLQKTKKILAPKGIFIVNCVCRDEEIFEDLVGSLKKVFNFVYVGNVDDDVNRVLAAYDSKGETSMNSLSQLLKKYEWFDEQLKQFRKM